MYFCVGVFFGALALAATARAQQGYSSDEIAIRALLDRVNHATNANTPEKGLEILSSVLSDKGYTFTLVDPQKPEAVVGGKQQMLDGLTQSLRAGRKWGVHRVCHIAIVGPLAYEIGESENVGHDARGGGGPAWTPWLNVWAKEDVGWKLIYSTPGDDILEAFRQLAAAKAKRGK
jgi:ketosteroid isomerase-like protein